MLSVRDTTSPHALAQGHLVQFPSEKGTHDVNFRPEVSFAEPPPKEREGAVGRNVPFTTTTGLFFGVLPPQEYPRASK